MIKTLILFFLGIYALSACKPVDNTPEGTISPTVGRWMPPTPSPAPTMSYLPLPSDSSLERNDITPESANLLIMESYPVQVSLELNGYLPNGCYQLRVNVQPVNAQNQVLVEVYSVVDPAAICAQVIQEYEVTVPLGSFPTGHYSVLVNGTEIGQFDS